MRPTHLLAFALPAACCISTSASAYEFNKLIDVYGSFNVGLEYRMVDNENGGDLNIDDHFEVQDAYSNIGIKGSADIGNGISAFYNYQLAVDVTSGRLGENDQTSWEGVSDVEENVATVGFTGGFGTFSVGRMWNAYYNRVSYTTDHFSSGWTGFDTYGAFQINRMVAYQSPEWGGFSFAVNVGLKGPAPEDVQDRFIVGATYNVGKTSLNVAVDNLADGTEQIGFSIAQGLGPITFSGKYEILTDGRDKSYMTPEGKTIAKFEDISIATALVEYSFGQNVLKLHYAEGDYPGYLGTEDGEGSEFGIGIDHTINDNLYVFAEYHASSDYCAYDLTEGGANGADSENGILTSASCSVVSVGTHLSF